jgi:hypothetical protein
MKTEKQNRTEFKFCSIFLNGQNMEAVQFAHTRDTILAAQGCLRETPE